MYKKINTLEELQQLVIDNDACVFYLSHEQCSVCKVLKPKLSEALDERYPKINQYYIDTVHSAELAGQLSVFTVPTVLVYFGGREYTRKSRAFGVEPFMDELERTYNLLFEE